MTMGFLPSNSVVFDMEPVTSLWDVFGGWTAVKMSLERKVINA